MPVNEVLMNLGSWGLTLDEQTPREVLDRLGYFGHVAIVPGRVNPAEYNDTLLTMARYVGVLTKRDFDDVKRIAGQSMALWLADSDDKGEVFESPVNVTGQTFANTITTLMSGSTAVVVGTLYTVAGTYSGTHVWQSRGKAVDYVCQTMGGEWRVNGNATLDAGPVANLFVTTPACVVVRKDAGKDLTLTGITGDMQLSRDVEDFTTRVVLLAQGEGESTATGSANIGSNPYLDIRGNAVKRTRLVSESGTSTGNATARAQLQLNRFTGTRNAMSLSANDYEIRGSFSCGDYVWVYDPDAGLYDTSQEITFRGQRINPIKLRVVETSWPVTSQMTVAYRHQDGTWINLTDFVAPETGSTRISVGELNRSLTNAGTEPVGPRPVPDSTIPGVVSWDLPFTTGVYLDALGNTWARILVNWDLPLNADGSTILDGSHYEIQYGVSPATDWQTTFAPWGELQAQVLDLSPGTTYDFRIRAVDLSNNQGAWSVVQTATANPDTIPPSTPAVPTVAGNRLSIQITHTLGKASGGTYNLELDLDHLEVHVGATSTFTADATTLRGKVAANSGMIQAQIAAVGTVPVEETTARFIRVIAVDQAGNRSSPSATATTTALLIDDAHITSLTVDKVTAGTISANWLIGASIRTASSGQRVELNTSGLQMFNSAGTQLVSIAPGSTFYLRSGTTGARLDLSTVTGLQIFNASGVRTGWLDVDGSFELRSAATGARVQFDGTGLAAYNSSGSQTVDIDAATGAATFVGQISTGFSGKRIVFNPAGTTDPEIRFYASSGTQTARIGASADNVGNYIGMWHETSVYNSTHKSMFLLEPDFWRLNFWDSLPSQPKVQMDAQPESFRILWEGSSSHQITIIDAGVFIDGAPYKSFIIDHPTDPDRWLIHACTESPQPGVEYWGETTLDDKGQAVVVLPAYFEALTKADGRYVSVNSCTDGIRNASATYPENGTFTIHGGAGLRVTWLVKAVRADADEMLVEPLRDQINVMGQGPYRYYSMKEPQHV